MEPADVLDLLLASPDGVYAVDMRQRVFFWNRAAEKILGWQAEDVLGKPCYSVLTGLGPLAVSLSTCAADCFSIQWARQGKPAPAQRLMASDRNGKRKLVSVTHLLVPSANPDAGALVHIFHEVVEPENPTAREVSRALSSSASTDEAICTRPAYLEPLTQRELEVLHLMAEGLGTQAIAERLVVAVPTVRNHAQRILAKLEVHTRLEAVALASRRGLLNF